MNVSPVIQHFQHVLPVVRIDWLENVPPCDGVSGRFEGHVLGVHLRKPARVTQQREGRKKSVLFSPGQLTQIPAGLDASCWTGDSTSFLHLQLVPTLFADEPGGRAAGLHDRLRFDDPVCRELALSIAHAARSEGGASRSYIESASATLALRLALLQGAQLPRAPRSALQGATLARVLDHLHAHLDQNPGVAELAQIAGLSLHHFSRQFAQATGLPPHQYLQRLRAERAAELLRQGRVSVLDVAHAVGYSNPSHFARFFRRATGWSPQAYRAQFR